MRGIWEVVRNVLRILDRKWECFFMIIIKNILEVWLYLFKVDFMLRGRGIFFNLKKLIIFLLIIILNDIFICL